MQNLQSIFSDPTYSTMASRSGLSPDVYWQTLHPKAKEQHLSRVGAAPATYVTEEQYANSQSVGANSGPNAYLSNNPVLAGYDGNPVQPGYPGSGPRSDVAPVLSSAPDADVVRNSPGALAAMDQGQVPAPGTTDTNVTPANDLTATAVLADASAPTTSTTSNTAEAVTSGAGPALSSNSGRKAPVSTGAILSSSGPKTSNARGSMMPGILVDRNEALIRIGGAMYSGALQGNGIGAATNEFAKIQDADRAAAEKQRKLDQDKAIAEARARASALKANSSTSKAPAAKSKALSSVNDAMYSMQRGLDAIADSRADGGNLTGIGGIFKGLFDNFTGDADANRRLTLSRLKIDDTLLRTAETKGAISNIEMALFLEPAPKNTMDEQIWVDWLEERMRTLRGVQYRLQTGTELPPQERSRRFAPSTAAPSNNGSSNMSAADAIVGI